ncbi:MAG: glycosyltransferase [Patescibacteria group bacterium]|nr:glycosyltransferase [Patescibacteria group bacterium]
MYAEKTSTPLLRGIYVFAIVSWLLVVWGYARFFSPHSIYWWSLVPLIAFLTLHFILSYLINFFYEPMDTEAHRRLVASFWNKTPQPPSVDVFLPICGEDTEILTRTFKAVSQLEYGPIHVYVLDDRGISSHEALASQFSFTYLSRRNKGYMKKAGNLKYGFDRSRGKFIAIFDADFCPHPGFIRELLPYMDDPAVAIIQSPQYFEANDTVHNRSALEYGAASVQEDFYRFIQVARSRLGAPVCCGSNALYRRSALEDIGGVAQIEHSEDIHTGFALLHRGWKVLYLPIILAIGICPDNLYAFFHQQHRWCSGNVSLIMRKEFWVSRLSFKQKICFLSGFMYYVSFPVLILFSFGTFFLFLETSMSADLSSVLFFLPCVLLAFVIMPLFRIVPPRSGNFFARAAYAYSYCHAVVTGLAKQSAGWEPTNTRRASISRAYQETLAFVALYFILYGALVIFAFKETPITLWNPAYWLILFWVFYNLFSAGFIGVQFWLAVHEEYKSALWSLGRKLLWGSDEDTLYISSFGTHVRSQYRGTPARSLNHSGSPASFHYFRPPN